MALLHFRAYPFLLEYFANKMWLGCKNNEYYNRKKKHEIGVASSLNAISTYYWPLWPFWEKALPLDRAVAARQQNTTQSNSLQMPGTGSFKGKMKAIHSSNDIGLWYHKAIWAQSSKVRKAHKDWWLEKYYISKVWQAIKRNYSFYDCVAEAPQGYLY